MRHIFVLPVYNEAENIPKLCESLFQLNEKDSFLLWINDGSSDNTEVSIQTYCKLSYHIITFPNNQGPGCAFQAAFKFLLSQAFSPSDLVITLEADNTSDLSTLNAMIEKSKTNDLVLASVYYEGGSFDQTNSFRLLISYIANFLVRLRFGLKQKTLTSFYRIYRISLLQSIAQHFGTFCKEKGFICKIELLVKANKLNAKIAEIPTTLRSSQRNGASKMKIIKTGWECIRFCFKSA